jgi:hypothetical protein
MTDDPVRFSRRDVLRLSLALSLTAAGKAFALRDVSGRMLLDVEVNSAGPFSFLLASGIGQSALSAALVSRLGLPASDAVSITSLESGALKLKDLRLPVAASEDVGAADGLLGVEGMSSNKIDIDLQSGEAAIVPTNTRSAPRGFRVVPARQFPNGVFLVSTLVGKLPVETIIDTGAIRTAGNRALQVALGGASVEPTPIYLARVDLGQPYLEFREFSEGKPMLRLGMDLLGFLNHIAFDFRRIEFHFKP